MDWTKTHVHFHAAHLLGAQAGLYYHYGIPEAHAARRKCPAFSSTMFCCRRSRCCCGFDDIFCAPHSRHTEVRAADIRKDERLTILAESHEAGVHIVEAMNGRQIFVLGHGEVRRRRPKEYERDLVKGMNPEVPRHYFRNDDPNEGRAGDLEGTCQPVLHQLGQLLCVPGQHRIIWTKCNTKSRSSIG